MRVDWLPYRMAVGLAVRVTVGGVMETVALLVVVPPGPTAVMIYTVIWSGVTVMEPFVVTFPIAGSIVHVTALVDVQVSVEDWPGLTVAGLA